MEGGPDDGAHCIDEDFWHVDGENDKRCERVFHVLAINAVELCQQAEVPLLHQRVEHYVVLGEVDGREQIVEDLSGGPTFHHTH